MRRVAIQAFRTAHLSPLRKLGRGNQFPSFTPSYAPVSSWNGKERTPPSSMRFRRFPIAVVSAVIGTGAWYVYKGTGVSESVSSNAQQSRSLSSVTGVVQQT